RPAGPRPGLEVALRGRRIDDGQVAESLPRDDVLEVARAHEHDLALCIANPLCELQRGKQMPDLGMHDECDPLAAKRVAIPGTRARSLATMIGNRGHRPSR